MNDKQSCIIIQYALGYYTNYIYYTNSSFFIFLIFTYVSVTSGKLFYIYEVFFLKLKSVGYED